MVVTKVYQKKEVGLPCQWLWVERCLLACHSAAPSILIAAPPMIQADALMVCHGEHRNSCSVYSEDSFYVSGTQSININASYAGEGPFSVQWYHNGKLFDCSTLKGVCRGITNTSTSQVCVTVLNLQLAKMIKINFVYVALYIDYPLPKSIYEGCIGYQWNIQSCGQQSLRCEWESVQASI